MADRVSKKAQLGLLTIIVAIFALPGIDLSCDSFSPSPAPGFTLPTMAGGNVTLSELAGTPVVLNFWSISCYWCRKQLPYLENVAQQGEGEIEVIAVNIIDNATDVKNFFGDYEPTMIVALDRNREVFVNYCQEYNNPQGSIPFTLFLDGEGWVQSMRIGAFTSEKELKDTLRNVLGITIP